MDSSLGNSCGCLAGLECLLDITRVLQMGSCFSAESSTPRPGTPSSPASGIKKRRKPKKRPGSRNSSFDYPQEELLHKIPGRLFLNASSNIASLFSQQGKKETNQDAMIVWENFCSRTDTVFCGVFDGHGDFGHMVARMVRDSLPLKLSAHWEANVTREDVLREMSVNTTGSINCEDTAFLSEGEESRVSVDLKETEKQTDIFQILKESFLKACKLMDRELMMQTNIDCFDSGTTAVTLIKQGPYLVLGNVGDSRAVLGTRDKDDSLIAVQLTVDLKPNLPAEAERIHKCGGRVFALQDEPEEPRVWPGDDDSFGLAMTRVFGDFCLKDFGVSSVPDISYRCLTEKDEFIVLASDGIWDVLSNKEVVDIVASAPARSSAARSVVKSAVLAWEYKDPTYVDDCAVVCLFLDSNSLSATSNAVSKEQLTRVDQTNKDADDPTSLDCSGDVWTENCSMQYKSQPGSALDGVCRVNTLLNLPRFVPGEEDKKAAAEAKVARK